MRELFSNQISIKLLFTIFQYTANRLILQYIAWIVCDICDSFPAPWKNEIPFALWNVEVSIITNSDQDSEFDPYNAHLRTKSHRLLQIFA